MRAKIVCCLSAVMVAVAMCASPYAAARQAHANPLVLTASEAAFAAICAALGLTVASNADAKALFADWELYTEDIDALAAQVSALQDAAIEAGTANGSLVNVSKQQVSQAEIDAINAMLDAAGKAGSLALDQLSMMASDGLLGIIPFALSAFTSHQIEAIPSDRVLGSFYLQGATWPITVGNVTDLCYPGTSGAMSEGCTELVFLSYSSSGLPAALYAQKPGATCTLRIHSNDASFFADQCLRHLFTSDSSSKGGYWKPFGKPSTFATTIYPTTRFLVSPGVRLNIYDATLGNIGTLDCSTGIWTGKDGVWTDNPDVNLGHDWWTDARDMVDVLNPAMGGALIGADAVIDGDYIVNRGSIAIPTDWSNINTWADALGATQSGVVQGALDGVISGATTGTAVNVGTGELVTDTVGNLVKPNAGTSVSPTTPKFDWGKFLDPSLYLVFPFCLPWDLVELVKTLSAEPQAPVIEWPMPALSGTQTLRVDLSPWSPVAAVLRAGELIVAAVGLVWVTKTMIRN